MAREYIFRIDSFLYNKETGEVAAKPEYTGEVIRCGECKHARFDEIYGGLWCDGNRVEWNHFCGYAERMDLKEAETP